MRFAPAVLVLLLPIGSLQAQEAEVPEGWETRFDRPAPQSALDFASTAEGWRIRTGPSGILYDPARAAEGEFAASAEISLLTDERREGFGIFIGGEHLQEPNQSYLYFLINGSGRYLIKHRAGDDTHVLVPWTEHSAIVQAGAEGGTTNVLAIEVGEDRVEFRINGEEVSSLPRSELDCDGIVGLRVNHNLDVRVSELRVEPKG